MLEAASALSRASLAIPTGFVPSAGAEISPAALGIVLGQIDVTLAVPLRRVNFDAPFLPIYPPFLNFISLNTSVGDALTGVASGSCKLKDLQLSLRTALLKTIPDVLIEFNGAARDIKAITLTQQSNGFSVDLTMVSRKFQDEQLRHIMFKIDI